MLDKVNILNSTENKGKAGKIVLNKHSRKKKDFNNRYTVISPFCIRKKMWERCCKHIYPFTNNLGKCICTNICFLEKKSCFTSENNEQENPQVFNVIRSPKWLCNF